MVVVMMISWWLLIDVLQRGLLLYWWEWSPRKCLDGISILKFGLKILVSIYYHRRRLFGYHVVLEGRQVAQVSRWHFLMFFWGLRNLLNDISLRLLSCTFLRSGIAWWVPSRNHQAIVFWSIIISLPLSGLIESRCLVRCHRATRLSLVISLSM
jgi:hypothetical protein